MKRLFWRQNSIALYSNLSKFGRILDSFCLNSLLIGCQRTIIVCRAMKAWMDVFCCFTPKVTESTYPRLNGLEYWSCFSTYILGNINTVFFFNMTSWFSASYHHITDKTPIHSLCLLTVTMLCGIHGTAKEIQEITHMSWKVLFYLSSFP